MLTAFYGLSGRSGFDHFVVPATWSNLTSVTFIGILSDAPLGAVALGDVGVGLGPGSAAHLDPAGPDHWWAWAR